MSYNDKDTRYKVFTWRGSFSDVHNRNEFFAKYENMYDVLYAIADATAYTDAATNLFESNDKDEALRYFNSSTFVVREGIFHDFGWEYCELFDRETGDVTTPDEIKVFHTTYSRDQHFKPEL